MKSRFMQEYSGDLGEWWKNHAEKELEEVRDLYEFKAYKDGGVVRWISNDQCIMDDMAEKMLVAGCISEAEREATGAARSIETASFIAEYKAQQASRPVSPEELYELKSAFGEGETIVDIISGRKIFL